MRSHRTDLLPLAGCCLLLCLLLSCGTQARTALTDRLTGQNSGSGGSGSGGSGSGGQEGARADYSAFLPDSARTPGDTLPVTADDVCTSGYAGKVRNVTTAEKEQVYQEYGIAHHAPHEYEVDHLVSLELGGSNRKENLWPQSYLTQPWNAHVKDKLEDKLHEMVCTGQIDLKTAQHDIATDWIATYRRVFHTDQPVTGAAGRSHNTRIRENSVPILDSGSDAGPDSGNGSATSGEQKVWVNTRSGKYFLPDNRYYGHTREGEYLSEQEAIRQGYSAAGGQR